VRLRRRLNTVLLQWFLLLVVITGTVWAISLPGLRRKLVDERLLLARTIAHSLDTTISSAIQRLGGLADDLPESAADMAGPLHRFRFQSLFGESVYVLDDHAQLVAADPPGVEPLSAAWLGYHEAVTPLMTKTGPNAHPVLAIVQPFKRLGRDYYLIAELNPVGSPLSQFLKDLELDPSIGIRVADVEGRVLASDDPAHLLRALPGAAAMGDRIGAHRPLVVDGGGTLTVMAPLRFASWGVVIEQHTADAYAGVNATSRALVITGFILAVVGVMLARTLSKSVVSPIRHLSRQAEAMRAGDLSSAIAVSGDHEVEVLARTLDEARARLRATLDELQAFNERLEEQVAVRTRLIVQQDEQRKVLLRRMLGATEDERRRLARELHDEIAQLLTVIQMSLHNVALDTPAMTQAKALLVKTQQEVHRIIHDLRPSLLDDLGLPTAMKSYAEDHLKRQGISVHLEIEDDLPPRPEIETVIFRIYQELVTNVLRHAKAEHVSIELYRKGDVVVLAVEDDGQGFDTGAQTDRAGLTGMRERAALVNGTIRFDSEAGMGTHVVVEIPLQ
jgi:signal transduction histidine kinase